MVHLMEPVCIEYIHEPQENQIPPEVSQDDLLGALEVELSQTYPIRNFLLTQWNMEVQDTSNYFLVKGLKEYIEIRSC